MEYLVRFSQWHETFRLAELKALAHVADIDMQVLAYSDEVSLINTKANRITNQWHYLTQN